MESTNIVYFNQVVTHHYKRVVNLDPTYDYFVFLMFIGLVGLTAHFIV